MAKIPDDLIRIAADWIADQERDPFEDRCLAPHPLQRPYYFDRAYKKLTRVAQECEIEGDSVIGTNVTRGRNDKNEIALATVKVTKSCVRGYFDFDVIPVFSWPPEIREKIIARTATQSSAV